MPEKLSEEKLNEYNKKFDDYKPEQGIIFAVADIGRLLSHIKVLEARWEQLKKEINR